MVSPSQPKTTKMALITLFGVIIFLSKVIVPTPLDKMAMIVQALLLSLSSLLVRMGATHAAIVGGLLTSMLRAGFFPFTLIFAIAYGLMIDGFFHAFKVRTPQGGVKTGRIMAALVLSTTIIGLLAMYVTATIGLMPWIPILYLTILIVGIASGAIAGYITSFIWRRYLAKLIALK